MVLPNGKLETKKSHEKRLAEMRRMAKEQEKLVKEQVVPIPTAQQQLSKSKFVSGTVIRRHLAHRCSFSQFLRSRKIKNMIRKSIVG
jgi:hypothetical protein